MNEAKPDGTITGDEVSAFMEEHRPGDSPWMKHLQEPDRAKLTDEEVIKFVHADAWWALKWVSKMLGIPDGQDTHEWLLDAAGAAALAFRRQFGCTPAQAAETMDDRGLIDPEQWAEQFGEG